MGVPRFLPHVWAPGISMKSKELYAAPHVGLGRTQRSCGGAMRARRAHMRARRAHMRARRAEAGVFCVWIPIFVILFEARLNKS
jgi:hypothetical protein